MSGWREMTLREAGVSLIDCDHRTPPASTSGYPYIAIPQLKQGHLDLSDVRRITREHLLEWTRKAKPQPSDVVLSRRCNPGETAVVPAGLECALGQNLVLLRADSAKMFPPFLRWLVRGGDWWEQIGKFLNVGAVFDSLKCADIPNFRLPIPPLPEQKSIASVLGALDDKIELNRQMNETLEAMGRALFQSWFVDATQAGLPEGWRESTIRELASNIQYGLTQSASIESIGPRFLRITDIQGGRVDWGNVPFCKVSPEEHERYRLKPGDVLVARTGATTGENIYLPAVPDALFASYLVRFQFVDPAMARLVGAFMRTPAYFDFVAGCIGGSAQPNASAQVLAGAELLVPPPELAKRFADTLAPLDQRIVANNEESRTLAAMRDALLPKLLSGELRVPAT